jgi:hypothetical protein
MKKKVVAALFGGLFLASGLGNAKEGGDQYPNGAENWFAGAVPPPGNYFINYFGAYSGKLKDGNGDNANHPATGGTTPKVDAVFDALRFVKVTNIQLLGGNWGWHVIVPVAHQSMDFNGKESRTGLGDITVSPLIISWHGPEWHTAIGLDINLPTGAYDKNDTRTSIGANYYSVEPIFAVSYLNKDGWEVSSKFMYNLKTKNKDSRFLGADGSYQSGDEFHMDYLVGKRFGDWGVGLSGYYLKQISDDEFNGVAVPAVAGLFSAGRKGQVFSIGPSVTYTTKGGTHFIGQWQHETKVENRFGGDKLWFKLIMPI